MSVTDRDKKILMLLVPIALVAAYWFLLFSPKREESAAIQEKLSQAETELQSAESQAASVAGAKQNFASDYTTVIRLGKAVPSTVDMPSLLMQLDRAARGTGIDFDKVATGERTQSNMPTPAGGGGSGNQSKQPQSGPGQAKQAAQNGANQANNTGTLPAQNGGASKGGATPPASGGAPAPGGTTPSGGAGGAPGLESIPLDFTFHGTFFDLADFFHRMKRFVRVANDDIVVRGRLMTVDSFNWKAEPDKWPELTAEVHATVYLAPKAEGVNAGATPQGPGATPSTPAAGGGAAPSAPSTPATTAPAATVK